MVVVVGGGWGEERGVWEVCLVWGEGREGNLLLSLSVLKFRPKTKLQTLGLNSKNCQNFDFFFW